MIQLNQPSMALNSPDISWSQIVMEKNWQVPAATTIGQIVSRVATEARGVAGGKLKYVVINCHGLPGWVGIGQGFNRTHIGMFRDWNGLVEEIMFVACLVARIPTALYQTELNTNYPGFGAGDGNIFCSELAQTAGAFVFAGTEEQRNKGGYSIGQVPSFEGLVMCYNPRGGVEYSYRNPSDWALNGRE